MTFQCRRPRCYIYSPLAYSLLVTCCVEGPGRKRPIVDNTVCVWTGAETGLLLTIHCYYVCILTLHCGRYYSMLAWKLHCAGIIDENILSRRYSNYYSIVDITDCSLMTHYWYSAVNWYYWRYWLLTSWTKYRQPQCPVTSSFSDDQKK